MYIDSYKLIGPLVSASRGLYLLVDLLHFPRLPVLPTEHNHGYR